ncbi:general transcription factor II-I repeat domain-containing protein 2B-like [Clavelina lepadiformis]|uniref:general transcription factor II-I repeat domain-containing protein 2B-like n=1 Tax=Clavelina lepadiformis TaxID=159417 RepID=UPI004041F151
MKSNLKKQSGLFVKENSEAEANTRASLAVSSIIAKKMKPFTDGEFVKECLMAVVDEVCPDKRALFSNVSLSARTVTRKVETISSDVKCQLRDKCSRLEYFSLAIDESTDVKDTAQLAVFTRGVTPNFDVTEEFVEVVPMHVTTDGAPAMTGERKGVVALLQKHLETLRFSNKIIKLHCIIHQEVLASKFKHMSDVMDHVVETVNFILARGLNHRQFQALLVHENSQYPDLVYYCDVRWLSRGSMLQRVYNLRKEIVTLLQQKNMNTSYFDDPEWVTDLAFLVDLTTHLNDLNLKLQGRGHLISSLYDSIAAFECKLRLWEHQLRNSNFAHFSNLGNNSPSSTLKYVEVIVDIKQQFASRFQDMRRHKHEFALLATPFDVDPADADNSVQMELIELQNNTTLKSKFHVTSPEVFYKEHLKSLMIAAGSVATAVWGLPTSAKQLFVEDHVYVVYNFNQVPVGLSCVCIPFCQSLARGFDLETEMWETSPTSTVILSSATKTVCPEEIVFVALLCDPRSLPVLDLMVAQSH